MRAFSFSIFIVTAVLLAGCGPEDRPVEFYTKAENAAEFAQALEICKKSGLSQKDKCASVWQAKSKMDMAEDKAMVERAIRESEGTTIVPQSRRQAPAAQTNPSQKATNPATAAADEGKGPAQN